MHGGRVSLFSWAEESAPSKQLALHIDHLSTLQELVGKEQA